MEQSQVEEMDRKDDMRRQSDMHSEKNGEEGAKISFKKQQPYSKLYMFFSSIRLLIYTISKDKCSHTVRFIIIVTH